MVFSARRAKSEVYRITPMARPAVERAHEMNRSRKLGSITLITIRIDNKKPKIIRLAPIRIILIKFLP